MGKEAISCCRRRLSITRPSQEVAGADKVSGNGGGCSRSRRRLLSFLIGWIASSRGPVSYQGLPGTHSKGARSVTETRRSGQDRRQGHRRNGRCRYFRPHTGRRTRRSELTPSSGSGLRGRMHHAPPIEDSACDLPHRRDSDTTPGRRARVDSGNQSLPCGPRRQAPSPPDRPKGHTRTRKTRAQDRKHAVRHLGSIATIVSRLSARSAHASRHGTHANSGTDLALSARRTCSAPATADIRRSTAIGENAPIDP